jgi:hypothetical protein
VVVSLSDAVSDNESVGVWVPEMDKEPEEVLVAERVGERENVNVRV